MKAVLNGSKGQNRIRSDFGFKIKHIEIGQDFSPIRYCIELKVIDRVSYLFLVFSSSLIRTCRKIFRLRIKEKNIRRQR
jgi:hypothetical protein